MHGKTRQQVMRTGFLAENEQLQYRNFFMQEPSPHIEVLKATDLFKVL